jgi:hypothetical protein
MRLLRIHTKAGLLGFGTAHLLIRVRSKLKVGSLRQLKISPTRGQIQLRFIFANVYLDMRDGEVPLGSKS